MSIERSELPHDALLRRYFENGAYADCYVAQVPRPVSHAEYVEAFYTTFVFKIERLLLRWCVSRPSTDDEAKQLACAERGSFAAWTVEDRSSNQLLLGDFTGRTKSWLMVTPIGQGTRLYFGSAVVPIARTRSGKPTLGFVFRALLGFHKLYSRILLAAARSRLMRRSRSR